MNIFKRMVLSALAMTAFASSVEPMERPLNNEFKDKRTQQQKERDRRNKLKQHNPNKRHRRV